MRLILWLHRYLGVAVGLLMALWCLSGFVMMYQPWPEAERGELLPGLTPLALSGECCALEAVPLPDDAALAGFSVEMMAGAPVLRTPRGAFDLRSGAPLSPPDEAAVRAVALGYASGNGGAAEIAALDAVSVDQWTIQQRGAGPFWRAAMEDGAGTWIYVAQSDGTVAQALTAKERFWTWLGAIPHWLYPRLLRQHSGVWVQVVIWTSAIGVFLTALGLFVGISKFRRRPNGRWSPYRKLFLWHHYTGLAFGVLTLTWVFSGLLTMDPWGLFQSRPFPEARSLGGEVSWAQTRRTIANAAANADLDGAVRIEGAPLAGQAYAMAVWPDGRAVRLGPDGVPAPLDRAEVEGAMAAAGGALDGASLELLDREDAYYYSLHGTVELPVWRVRTAEDDPRLLYVNASTGRALRALDGSARTMRWLENGLHSLDFPGLRARPLWDVVVLPLLAGVTLVCLIGVWLGWRRLKRDALVLRRRLTGRA